MSRGQVAVEYLVISVFLILIVSALFFYSGNLANDYSQINLVSVSAKSLANAVNLVSASGVGSKIIVQINLPSNVEQQILSNKIVGWKTRSGNSLSEIYYETDANVVGEIPLTQGIHFVSVEMLESGFVRIGTGLKVFPNKINAVVLPGKSLTFDLSLENATSSALTGISSIVSSNIFSYATVSGLANSLAVGAIDAFTATFSVSSVVEPAGIKQGFITFYSGQDYNDVSLIQLIVPHVLKDLNILLYSDSNYALPAVTFVPGSTLYYEILFADQTGRAFNLNDLNIFVQFPVGTNIYSSIGNSTLNQKYLGAYIVSCSEGTGSHRLLVDANSFSKISDFNDFTISSLDQNSLFGFDWNDSSGIARLTGGNKKLIGWAVRNNSSCGELTVEEMKATWSNGAKLKKIKLNNETVYSDGSGVSSNTWIELEEDAGFLLPALTSYENNELEFSSSMSGQSFTISFKFSDGTIYTTTSYAPS